MSSLFTNTYDDDYRGSKEKKNWKNLWMKNQLTILSSLLLSVLALAAYHLVSDGDFSFLMTLGSLLVLFSFCSQRRRDLPAVGRRKEI
jgi:amino acid permease